MPNEQLLKGVVVFQECLNEQLRHLRVSVEGGLEFVAGQFTKIGLPGQGDEDKPLLRAYSFVNPPTEQHLDFLYDVLVEGGNLTLLLDKLKEGDELLVSARPNGLLVLGELPKTSKELFLIGTGTGVGPFLSILRTDEPWEKFSKVTLVYSVRHQADMAFQDIVSEIQRQKAGQFCYVPIVTREQVEGCQQKRVTDLLGEGELSRLSGVELSPTSQFMLCGNPEMIKQMCEMLKEMGFERNRRARPGNVTIEKYW